MKKRVFAGALLAAMISSASVAVAGETKIGVVDVRTAIQNTQAYQKGMKKIQALQAQKQKELDGLRAKIAQSEKDLMGQSMAMSPDRLAQKQQELKDLRKLFQRKQQDAQEELMGESQRLEKSIITKFYDVVRLYGKEQSFSLIIPKSTVVYTVESQDVTGEITKRLDQK